MYQYEEKKEFEETFDAMREKVSKSTWLDSIYLLKHKWAECYMLDVFSIGMRSTQLSESLNNALIGHLKSDLDIIRFLKRVKQVVQEKRDRELQSEFESRKKQPRIGVMTPILQQASTVYTPAIFEVFQGEYVKSLAAYIAGSNGTNEFVIAIGAFGETFTLEEERNVIVNPTDQIVSCSCRLFERVGILCRHALKGLDLANIKLVPERYILKRWTRDARSGIIQDMHGRDIVENPKLDATLRYKNLYQRFLPLASRAADFEDCYLLVEEALHTVNKQVEEKIKGTPKTDAEKSSVEATFNLPEEFAHVAGLQKKERQKNGSKRTKNWVDKFNKKKKSSTQNKGAKKNGAKKNNAKKNSSKKKKTSKSVQHEEIGSLAPDSSQAYERNTTLQEYQGYESLNCFSQLLMSSSVVEDVSSIHSFGGMDDWKFTDGKIN